MKISIPKPVNNLHVEPLVRYRCRLAAEEKIAKCGPFDFVRSPSEYTRELEKEVYLMMKRQKRRYIDKMKQIVYNLGKNGKFILENYGKDVRLIVALDDDDYGKGTDAEDFFVAHRQQLERRTRILESGDEVIKKIEEDAQVGDVEYIVCRNKRCRGKNITYDSKQTRGGDEATTLFIKCKDCGERWREN